MMDSGLMPSSSQVICRTNLIIIQGASAGLRGSEPSALYKPKDLVVLPFPAPDHNFTLIKYKDPNIKPLPAFNGIEDINLKLPDHVAVSKLNWLSIWCRKFAVNFGHVKLDMT